MITVNKEEKRIDISGEPYEIVSLLIDMQEYKVPLSSGEGCLTNIQENLDEVKAYAVELEVTTKEPETE